MKLFFILVLILYKICFMVAVNIQNNDKFIDLSKECRNNLKVNYFLTQGMGHVDSTVVILNDLKKNCTLSFYSQNNENGVLQIIVVEELVGKRASNYAQNTKVIICGGKRCKRMKISDFLQKDKIFVFSTKESKSKVIIMSDECPGLKITSTAAQIKTNEKCPKNNIECVIDTETVCLDSELACDGNINCGLPEHFDESVSSCYTSSNKNFPIAVATALFAFAILFVVMLRCCYSLLPKIPKQFFSSNSTKDDRLLFPLRRSSSLDREEIFSQDLCVYENRVGEPLKDRGDGYEVEQVSSIEEKLGSQAFSPIRKHANANFKKNSKRLTTNSPVELQRLRKKDRNVQDLNEDTNDLFAFDRELWFSTEFDEVRNS